jgi:hypothetical protein
MNICSCSGEFFFIDVFFYYTFFFFFSALGVFAYVWMAIVLLAISPDEVEIWEAVVTLALFPILLFVSYAADKDFFMSKKPAAILDAEGVGIQMSKYSDMCSGSNYRL